jgi:hypothetical protein
MGMLFLRFGEKMKKLGFLALLFISPAFAAEAVTDPAVPLEKTYPTQAQSTEPDPGPQEKSPYSYPGGLPAIDQAPASELNDLLCPAAIGIPVTFPPPIYALKAGDCALVGRETEILSFLSTWEGVASTCRAWAPGIWHSARHWQSNILDQIARLVEFHGGLSIYPQSCWRASNEGRIVGTPGIYREGSFLTSSLQRITENVQNYCQRVEGLMNSLARDCGDIRGIVECRMNDLATRGLFPGERLSFQNWIRAALGSNALIDLEEYYRNQVLANLEEIRRSLSSSPPRCLPAGDIE